MGQFKPMVKMQTTEPSVELKLKKGGTVSKPTKKMAGGGALSTLASTPALVGRPAVNAPVRSPGKPPMAARRKAMAPRPAMKEGGETKKEHEAEKKEMKGLKKELKSHEGKPASKAHKGLKCGGDAKKYATGGSVKSSTKMHTAEHGSKAGGSTGEVKEGTAGYKTGGVIKGQGGFKKGGHAKK